MEIKVILLLVIGFFLLIKGSDIFVDAVSSIATNFKMPKILIALTVAAFGTCAPELAISIQSISTGNGDVAVANVLGSCIVNIALIIGLAATVFPIKVKDNTVKKELPLLVLITSVFVLLFSDGMLDPNVVNTLTRIDGAILLFLFLIFMYYIFSTFKKRPILDNLREKPKYNLVKSIVLSIICLIVVVTGSNLVVDNAVIVAEYLNVSQKIITMTVIVIGTSLPELTMTVISAKKREFDIAVGNIIGTNIFNIGVVLGIPILIYGNVNAESFNAIDVIVVFIAAFSFFLFSRNDKEIKRFEGVFLLFIFIAYYAYMFLAS